MFVLACYRLISPAAEWRLHRQWYGQSALADLLGADESLADPHVLYRCHDRLLAHKTALFDHLTGRWRDLFNASFEVLLYDLTSTYFESDSRHRWRKTTSAVTATRAITGPTACRSSSR